MNFYPYLGHICPFFLSHSAALWCPLLFYLPELLNNQRTSLGQQTGRGCSRTNLSRASVILDDLGQKGSPQNYPPEVQEIFCWVPGKNLIKQLYFPSYRESQPERTPRRSDNDLIMTKDLWKCPLASNISGPLSPHTYMIRFQIILDKP